MKNKALLFLPLIALLLPGCGNSSSSSLSPIDPRPTEELSYYAMFMYNYPRASASSPNGNDELVENMLYLKQEIELGKLINEPEEPTREGYEFQGWFKEKTCLTIWDFAIDVAEASTYLYAKWGKSDAGDYVEPEYVYPETIIEDANYRVTGILNTPLNDDGSVNLTNGAINRLINYKEDVSFAINYERKNTVNLVSATYDEDNMEISLETSSNDNFLIKVNNVTASYKINNSTYEEKAKNYESLDKEFTNYHIVLAGSSSMELWDSYQDDLNPIIAANHGISGSTVEQWTNQMFDRLVKPYSPKAVVYYIGVNNIINSGNTGEETGEMLIDLFDKTHEFLPHSQIFFVQINKLPSYGHLQDKFDVANNMAKNYQDSHPYLTCIDAGKGLLKSTGNPHFAYFRTDGLHMSRYGYVIWGQAIKDALMSWLG